MMIHVVSHLDLDDGYIYTVQFALSGGIETHRVSMSFDAIDNRRAFYDLDDEQDAIDAILREHFHRLAGKDQCPPRRAIRTGARTRQQSVSWHDIEPAERGRITGGLDHSIAIRRS